MVTPEQIASAEAQIVEESKRIEFYLTEYSVELLAAKMHSKEFVIPRINAMTRGSPRESRGLSNRF